MALLEKYHARQLLAPSSGDVLVARLIALVGDHGEVTVSTEQAEFDRIATVTPHRRNATRSWSSSPAASLSSSRGPTSDGGPLDATTKMTGL